MHYRVISNAEAISKFSDVRNVHSLYSKEKGWINSVHTFFNLCPKIKKGAEKYGNPVGDQRISGLCC